MNQVVHNKPKQPFSDRVVSWLSPQKALNRLNARTAYDVALSYRGGVQSRLDRSWDSPARKKHRRYMDTGGDAVRDRARELDEKNPIATALLDRVTENVIGEGMRLQAKTKNASWNKKVEALFADWNYLGADVRQMASFDELQSFVFRATLRDGDVGLILLKDGSLQVVESDDIETPPTKTGDENVVDGVAMTRHGRPLGFYVVNSSDNEATKYKRIPADDFVFVTRRKRSKDTRGEPIFAQSAHLFDMIDGNIEAVITAAQMAACFGLVVESESTASFDNLGNTTRDDGTAVKSFPIEPGMVQQLRPGERMSQVTPQHPSQNYADFVAMLLRIVGLPLGLPLELILLDFSKTNFSSARASLLQAYRAFQVHQHRMQRVLRRIYQWRVSKWIKEGKIAERPDAWSHNWIAPGWQWVDPMKEAQSHLIGLDAGYETLSSIAASMGKDWQDILVQRQVELAEMEAMNIPRVASNATRDPGTPGQEEKDDAQDDSE